MFEIGNIHYTLGVKELIEKEKIDILELMKNIEKHKNNVLQCCIKKLKSNKIMINNSFSTILNSYTISNIKVWFITNLYKYTYTTILLPNEY